MVNWENGKLVTPAKVNADGTITPAVYSGKTPASAENLNKMQTDLIDDINDINIGATNILRGTNSVTQLTATSEWVKGTWRAGGGGNGTRESIKIGYGNYAPNPDIKTGWRLTSTYGSIDIAQENIPVNNGQEYTLSCYARKVSGDATLRLSYGKSVYVTKTTEITDTNWKKYSFTFIIGEKADGSTEGFTGVFFGNGSIGTLEICGMQLETGNKATDGSLSPYDIDNKIVLHQHNIPGSASAGYVYLGNLEMNQMQDAIITLYTGNGYNAQPNQNSIVRIFLKGASNSRQESCGVYVEQITNPNNNFRIIVKSKIKGNVDIYVYFPYGYFDGFYTIQGNYKTYIHKGTVSTSAPTEGTDQPVEYQNRVRELEDTFNDFFNIPSKVVNGENLDNISTGIFLIPDKDATPTKLPSNVSSGKLINMYTTNKDYRLQLLFPPYIGNIYRRYRYYDATTKGWKWSMWQSTNLNWET